LLVAPAYAQTPNINLIPELQSKTPEEKEAEAARDKAYKESLKKIPDAKVSSDPWGTVRSGDAPKPSTKTAAPKDEDQDRQHRELERVGSWFNQCAHSVHFSRWER
jgi:hypothetical protein